MAQLAEQLTFNLRVGGSNPSGRTRCVTGRTPLENSDQSRKGTPLTNNPYGPMAQRQRIRLLIGGFRVRISVGLHFPVVCLCGRVARLEASEYPGEVA